MLLTDCFLNIPQLLQCSTVTVTANEQTEFPPDEQFIFCSAWKIEEEFKHLRITPAQSAQTLLSTISKLSPEDSGRFLNTDGSTFPW